MIDNLPNYANIIFIIATVFSIFMIYKAAGYSKKTLLIVLGWTIIQGVLAWSQFYLKLDTVPPRMPFTFFPTLALILALFNTSKGRTFIDSLNLKTLTWLHIVRIPVEFCLLWLFIAKSIPQIMTFEGANFDIIAGLTAPLMVYLYFIRKNVSAKIMLVWNVVCLLLLINIVVIALLCAPMPIQQLAFDQPNIGVLYFPFVWLPSVIVPIVMFSHFVAIRRFRKG
ncbi:hypothetical protein N8368_03025 [Bacteroidia bacterium]|nr:hypothetical protein [Bacteroidia bacterium]MDB9882581.1 hypothetical protein [Bacteroidia bacterium]MDC1395461.1 hypothetical protein [Bacteroidia bacterium]